MCVLVLLDLDNDLHLVEHRYRHLLAAGGNCDRVIVGVKLNLAFECHESFDPQSARVRFRCASHPIPDDENGHVPGYEDAESISERPNHIRILDYRFFRAPGLQSEANIELNARPARHLGHTVAFVDDFEHTFDVGLGVQTSVERSVAYCRRELAVGKDVLPTVGESS